MSDKSKFWITLLIATFGAFGGLASVKMIFDYFKPIKIVGKMISRYNNLNVDKTLTFFLFKLSIISKNKPFNLGEIKCEIEYPNGEKFLASAENPRYIGFSLSKLESPQKLHKLLKAPQKLPEAPHKLLVPAGEFLNNTSLLPANKNIVGYIYFKFNGNLDHEVRSTTFIFESFENKTKKLKFKESDIHEDKLFFDDTIWQMVDIKGIENHSSILDSTKEKTK